MEFLKSERVRFAILSLLGGMCLYLEDLKLFIFYTVMALLFIYGEVVKLSKDQDKGNHKEHSKNSGN